MAKSVRSTPGEDRVHEALEAFLVRIEAAQTRLEFELRRLEDAQSKMQLMLTDYLEPLAELMAFAKDDDKANAAVSFGKLLMDSLAMQQQVARMQAEMYQLQRRLDDQEGISTLSRH